MIVYDLECRTQGHRFEGWFGSSDDFAKQQERGLLTCPHCGSAEVCKAVMAPAVGRKSNQLVAPTAKSAQPVTTAKLPPEAVKMMAALHAMQAEALKQSTWVGDKFADQARAQHYGEAPTETIHGQASLAEAKDLLEEGIAVMPLPFPVAPPGETN